MARKIVLRGALAALLLAAGGLGLSLVPRLVAGYSVREAARRGFELSARDAKIRWLAVELHDATIRLEGVEGLTTRFESVNVALDWHGHVRGIVARGGEVSAVDVDALREQIESWRGRRAGGTGGATSAPTVDVEIAKLSAGGLHGEDHIELFAAHIVRDASQLVVSVGSVRVDEGKFALTGNEGQVIFEGHPPAFRGGTLAAASIIVNLPPRIEESTAPLADVPEPAAGTKGKRAPESEPRAPLPKLLPDLHALRGAVAALATEGAASFPEGGRIHVDALTVRVQRGEEELSLGSGSFDVDRDSRRIEVGFSTSPLAHATPLSLKADFPTGSGDIEVSASGGPVSLGLLGMRDGGLLHLLDVDRASFGGRGRVVLDDKGQALTFDLEGSVHGLSMRDGHLARDAVRGMDLGVRARGVVDDKGGLRLDEAEASVGSARASVHGGLSQTTDRLSAAFDFDFPTSSCQALLTSVPSALLPTVGSSRMDGTFSLRGRLAFDTQNLDGTAFDYDVSDRCRLVDVPADLDKARFSHSFTHVIYSKKGELEEETTGPGSANWTDLDNISPYMQVAVLTTEDGAFFHHHGFSHAAIRHALIDNIKAGRFVRGASTITMQLAKNLFLSREKTLSRKLEELVLADYLEQTFTKDEMMELYLNIIEFGPDVYGVTAAAAHYFGRPPGELNLAECLFLSSILPNPVVLHKVYEKTGQPTDGWMRTIRGRMQLAEKNGLISPAELAEGLTELVVFHHEGDPPPAPRQVSAVAGRRENGGDWQELN